MNAWTDAELSDRRWMCMGMSMVPLTVGHMMLLDALENNALTPPDNETELALRVFVCSQPWEESRKDLSRWWSDWFFALWALLLSWRKVDYLSEAESWMEYVRDNAVGPDVLTGKGDRPSDQYGSPFHWQLCSVAMKTLRMSRAEVWGEPVLRIKCLLTALGELEGNVKLWSPANDALWSHAEREDAKEANGVS